MANIKKIYANDGRTSLLRKTIETATSDNKQNNHYISDSTLEAVKTFLPGWTSSVIALNTFLSERSREIREKNAAILFLDLVMRDIWEVLKRRVRRLNQPVEVLTYYQLPLSGNIPKAMGDGKLITLAQKMIEGESAAIAAGYEPMINPGMDDLQAALDKAKNELSQVAPADRAYDEAEEKVEKLRPQADALISDIVDELKFLLRKKDPASQRRIIQSYGVEIEYNKGEGPSEDSPIDMN